MTDQLLIGSPFNDFLEEEEILAEVSAVALERVLAWQISQDIDQTPIISSSE